MNADNPVMAQVSQVSLVRAIRGPILMIVLGALFAIDHYGATPFSRTWPALLIVIGVMKLLERSSQRPLN